MTLDEDFVSTSMYDSFALGDAGIPSLRVFRLFGNANVGVRNHSNLSAAGMLNPRQGAFVVQRWYARTNLPAQHAEAFHAWSHTVSVTFVVGTRFVWQLPLSELLQRRPRDGVDISTIDPWPLVVPPREYVGVEVACGDGARTDAVVQSVGSSPPPWPRVWIHFDGLAAQHNGHDLRTNAVIDRLLAVRQKAKTVDERAVAWILRQVEDAPDDVKAQAQAFADGLLEGRHYV